MLIFGAVNGIRNILVFVVLGIGFNLMAGGKWATNPEFTYKSSFLLPHSGAVRILMNGRIDIFEAAVGFPNLGSNGFKKTNAHSYWGAALVYSNFSNPDYIGFGLGVMGTIEMSLFKSKQSDLTFRIGFGVAYLDKPFDRLENIRNGIIATKWNNVDDFQFRYNLKLDKKMNFYAGWGLMHYSNGALGRPNLGMNLPYIHLGTKYLIDKVEEHELDSNTLRETKSRYSLELNFVSGIKGREYAVEGKFPVGGIALKAGLINRHHKFELITDVVYDGALKLVNNTYLGNEIAEFKNSDYLLMGIMAGYERYYGNLSLYLGVGFYYHSIYNTVFPNDKFLNTAGYLYNRAGIKYYVNRLNFGLGVKTHLGEADNLEFSIGYQLLK